MISRIVCRLRQLLIYVFKEVPVLFLIEIWAIIRVITTMLIVVYIIASSFWKNNIDACILSFFK